jgi:hypothetical protein
MSEVDSLHSNAVAPSVRALLAAFHEDTVNKLKLAPADSTPIFERTADGSLWRVDPDGWISDPRLDLADATTILPTSVVDNEAPRPDASEGNPMQPKAIGLAVRRGTATAQRMLSEPSGAGWKEVP